MAPRNPERDNSDSLRRRLTRALPQRNDAGQIIRWFGSNTDVDDLRQAEQELRVHHDHLEELVQPRTAELEREVAERQRAEPGLVEAKQRWQALMNALPVGVSFSDDLTCQRIPGNPAVLAQFGAAAGRQPLRLRTGPTGAILP